VLVCTNSTDVRAHALTQPSLALRASFVRQCVHMLLCVRDVPGCPRVQAEGGRGREERVRHAAGRRRRRCCSGPGAGPGRDEERGGPGAGPGREERVVGRGLTVTPQHHVLSAAHHGKLTGAQADQTDGAYCDEDVSISGFRTRSSFPRASAVHLA